MSTLPTLDPQGSQTGTETPTAAQSPRGSLAVCVPSMPSEDLAAMVGRLSELFPEQPLLIASPDQAQEESAGDGGARLVPYPARRSTSAWVLSAADYSVAAKLLTERDATGVLVLGADAHTLSTACLRSMRTMLSSGVDLVVPRYLTGPQEGLVNSALLYPLTRALFGVNVRFPLPLDAALSPRMVNRLAQISSRTPNAADDTLVWPVAEAALSGFTVGQIDAAERHLPQPQEADLNVLFPAVTSALFSDIEAKATFWQRPRAVQAAKRFAEPAAVEQEDQSEEIRALVEGFRLAFANLREIWSLVLPPQSLLALKKLSQTPAETFSFPPALWARVVYDFALAFHMRTLNRGHLLGAMTPLYLAWVAGLLRESRAGIGSEASLEGTASAFEQEKPYLVSRWRWPDRFNP